MKSLKDRRVPLARRIELIVAWTEEWDWDPIRQLLETWEPPQINIAFDAFYPVVVAEKGWGDIKVTFPPGQPTCLTRTPLSLGFPRLSRVISCSRPVSTERSFERGEDCPR